MQAATPSTRGRPMSEGQCRVADFVNMEPCHDDWCHIGTIELGGFPGLQNGTAWVYTKGYVTIS